MTLFSPGFYISNFTRPTGTTAGGKILVVEGSGFDATTSIYMGLPSANAPCTLLANSDSYFELSSRMTDPDPSRVRQFIACTTPAHVAGTVNIYAVDSGLQTISSSVYTYYTPTNTNTDNVCDDAYGTNTTGPLRGANTAASPQIVCNKAQLALVANNSCSGSTDNYISVQDNLYFGTLAWTPLNNGQTPTLFDGNNNFLIGLRPSSANDHSGLWDTTDSRCVAARATTYQNLNLSRVRFLNANLASLDSNAAIGSIAGDTGAGNITTNNTHIEAMLTDYAQQANVLGGMFGWDYNGTFAVNNSTVNLNFTAPSGGFQNCGGLAGTYNSFHATGDVVRATITTPCSSVGGIVGNANYVTLTAANSNLYLNIGSPSNGSVGGLSGGGWDTQITASNINVSGTITGKGDVGGLGTRVSGVPSVQNVNVYATIVSTGGGSDAGGFFGEVSFYASRNPVLNVSNSSFSGSVTGTVGGANVGGLVGLFDSANPDVYTSQTQTVSITNFTLAPTAVISGNDSGLGGVFGFVNLNIAPVFTMTGIRSEGTITGGTNSNWVGGLIGQLNRGDNTALNGDFAEITDSLVSGSVTGASNVGGLVGGVTNSEYTNANDAVFAVFANDYVTAAITGSLNVGGLAGSFTPQGSASPFYFAKFQNSFARASFPNMSSAVNAGRLIGFVSQNAPSGMLSSVYYDAGYAPGTVLSSPIASGTLAGSSGTGLTDAQFSAAASYTGWDFSSTWQLTNGLYPTLISVPQ